MNGMTIKEARKLAGWTQTDMTDKLGIPRRTVQDWERGIRVPPDYVERLVVAEILRRIEGEKNDFQN